MIQIEMKPTNRGFLCGEFRDANGVECSVQESSAVGGFLWLGCNDANATYFPGNGTGWHPYPLPQNVNVTTRMHLSANNVKALLPILQRFVDECEACEELDEGAIE